MNQILDWLSGGDLRSDGFANEVAKSVLQNPQLFDDLYQGLSASDDVVRARSADALEKVTRERPDLIVEHLTDLKHLSHCDHVPMVKMHLAMIFGHLAPYPEHVNDLRSTLIDLLNDESVFTRSWAIVSLCIIARKYPGKNEDIIRRIVPLQEDKSVAIRSKVRKAVTILSDSAAPFPSGWIKSEQLKGLAGS
jgi:HEAT repeat protein